MLIRGRSTRVSQPTGPVEIDWANPLTSGLGFNLCNFLRRDAAGDALITRTASLAQGTTTLGQGLSSAANAAFSVPQNLSSTNVITLGFVFRTASTATQILAEHTANYSSNAGGFAAYFDAGNLEVGVSNGAGGFSVVRCSAPAVGRTTKILIIVGYFASVLPCARIWYDGIEQSTTQPSSGIIGGNFANSTTNFLGRNAASIFANGVIHDISIWRRALADDEVRLWNDSPWRVYRPAERRVWLSDVAGGGATNYSLTADVGAYSLTGIDATLTYTPAAVNYSLTADAGAYALTGVDAGLTFARRLLADAGSYSLTGIDATLAYVPGGGAYTLTADTGAYSLTGNDAGLTFARSMTADVGSYTLNGFDAGLLVGRRLTADTGVYALAGVDAALIYTALGPTAYALTAETGSYVLIGVDAALRFSGEQTPFGGGFFTQALRRKLFEDELRAKLKKLPDQVAEVIEDAVILAIDKPKTPTAKELRQVFEAENIPYREAYRKAVVSMVQQVRQREEDDEEEEATALAFLI